MRVGVLVVIALRQITQLPTKTFSASVVFAWITKAIAAPITKRFCNALQAWLIGEHCSTLTHSDVVRGIKAKSCKITKCADLLVVIGGSKRVATIFNQPKVVLLAQTRDDIKVVWIAKRVGQHNGLGLR